MTRGICRSCGKELHSAGPYAAQCGACNRERMRAALVAYKYQRTHVHVWPTGAKTMESGKACEVGVCPGAAETGPGRAKGRKPGTSATGPLDVPQIGWNDSDVIRESA